MKTAFHFSSHNVIGTQIIEFNWREMMKEERRFPLYHEQTNRLSCEIFADGKAKILCWCCTTLVVQSVVIVH